MSVMTVRYREVLLAAACLALPACWDLELPNVPPDGGAGPTLTVHSPLEGQTISLNAPVSLDADSVNGVASVTVTCGGAPSTGVFSWNVPPYTGVVDFTRCTLVTSGVTDSGVGQLQLTFIGVDTLGHASTKSINVLLDTTTASLSAVLPERVAPLSQLNLTIGSDRPLLLPPTVRLAGREADGIVQHANPDGGSPLYDVTFLRAPGLGIDNYSGDPFNVPFEVLVEVEKSTSLTVDARATNGNASHLEQNVLLSRVLWDRIVPGRIAIDAAEPVATARGIQVALAKSTTVNATADWLPGFFWAKDGTYVPFDPNGILNLGRPAPRSRRRARSGQRRRVGRRERRRGWSSGLGHRCRPRTRRRFPRRQRPHRRGIRIVIGAPDAVTIPMGVPSPFPRTGASWRATSTATATCSSPGRTPARAEAATSSPSASRINGPRPATGYSVPFVLDTLQSDGTVTGPVLTRMDDLVRIRTPSPAFQRLLRRASDPHRGVPPGLDRKAFPRPRRQHRQPGSGARAAHSGADGWRLRRAHLPLAQRRRLVLRAGLELLRLPRRQLRPAAPGRSGPRRGRLHGADGQPAAPGGGWKLRARSDHGLQRRRRDHQLRGRARRAQRQHRRQLSGQGRRDASDPAPGSRCAPGRDLLRRWRGDRSGVTLRNNPPYTTFEAWLPDGAAPVATARIPGLYVYGAATYTAGGERALGHGRQSHPAAQQRNARRRGVALWPGADAEVPLPLPRIAQNSSLIGGVDQGNVYYVDPFNNDIVALKRF